MTSSSDASGLRSSPLESSSSSAAAATAAGGGGVVDPSVFVPRRVALSLLRSRRTVHSVGVAFRRGLHCECCIHQCSYGELMEYCRAPDSFIIQ